MKKSHTQTPQTEKFDNVQIASGKKGDNYGPCEPSICVNPANTQNIAAGAILNRAYHSQDGGRTWATQSLNSSLGVFGDPVIVADFKGNFYYAHLSDPEGKQWSGDSLLDCIVVQKSVNGGVTYDDGVRIGANHPKDQDKHWLCVDPRTNQMACTWTEFDKYNSKDHEKDHSRIMFSNSADGGKNWSKALNISQYEGNCEDDDQTTEGAVPAYGPNGELYVAWAWNDKIWFDRSLDNGKTWLKEDIVAADQPGGWTFDIPGITRCNGMPILVCDLSNGPNRGTLYLNWSDQRKGESDTDIWFAKSVDSGKHWSKPKRVNDDAAGKQQFLSWMAIDQKTGHLYTLFYDRRAYDDKRTDVYVALSEDGGSNWRNLKVSDTPFDPNQFIFFGDYSQISAHAGVVRPIWTRLDKGILSVWTAIMDFKTPMNAKGKDNND